MIANDPTLLCDDERDVLLFDDAQNVIQLRALRGSRIKTPRTSELISKRRAAARSRARRFAHLAKLARQNRATHVEGRYQAMANCLVRAADEE